MAKHDQIEGIGPLTKEYAASPRVASSPRSSALLRVNSWYAEPRLVAQLTMPHSFATQPPREIHGSKEPLPDPWQLVGTEFEGGITVEAVVGVGGFGTVYRGFHRHFRAPVALKVLRCPDDITPSQRQDVLHRFEQETIVLFRLSRLTLDVASCLAAGTFLSKSGDETPYIVQEWLEGRSLDELLNNDGDRERFSLRRAVNLLSGAARALSVAHDQGIVHRDIKPSNVFAVTRDGQLQAKLLDFGIAKLLTPEPESEARKPARTEGFRLLSVEYAAPEQWDESLGVASPRTDLFSLALVLVEMLCGRLALRGSNPNALMFAALNPSQRPTPRAQGAETPDRVEDLFRSALAVHPEHRPASLSEWWQDLEHAANEHAEWAALPPILKPVALDNLGHDRPSVDAALGEPPSSGRSTPPSTRGAAEPRDTSLPDSTPSTQSVPPRVSSDFFTDGDALTREASRQHRRRLGVWVTSGVVGACSALIGIATWLNAAPSPSLSQTRAALSPALVVELPPADSVLQSSQVRETPADPSVDPLASSAPEPWSQNESVVESLAASSDDALPPSTPSSHLRRAPAGNRRASDSERTAVARFAPLPAASQTTVSPTAIRTGELRLNSIPPSAIVIDGRPIGSTPKANVHLSPGSHQVTFVHPELGKRKLLVLVEPGKSQTLSVKF